MEFELWRERIEGGGSREEEESKEKRRGNRDDKPLSGALCGVSLFRK